MTTVEAIEQVRAVLLKRYGGSYWTMKAGDRVMLAMSVLANDVRVREVGGNNLGPWVQAILGATGLHGAYSWCAATVEFCMQVAKIPLGPSAVGGAARVAVWRNWAANNGRLTTVPARGRLCLLVHPDGTGHMGDIAEVRADGSIRSYEGNTTPGPGGDQRDGGNAGDVGGVFMRVRAASFWQRFITLD